jgi:hypothetical protein
MVLGEANLAMGGGGKAGGVGRAERLAAALKENLKKRKEQARVRRQAESRGRNDPTASAPRSKRET